MSRTSVVLRRAALGFFLASLGPLPASVFAQSASPTGPAAVSPPAKPAPAEVKPGWEVIPPLDQTAIAVVAVRAFPALRFDRPILLDHAGDGSGRLFVGTQKGPIYVMPNRDDIAPADVKAFLDLSDRVTYKDRENEEGLLGLAFDPDYKTNGHLYVYYTATEQPHLSVISRFTVGKDDPNRADPDSELRIMAIPQPFWNHNGGTLVFGPDKMLYVALGDGGKARDPLRNGQNLGTLLGSILRIDVSAATKEKPYAIPADNPFVGRDGARPEIYAYGFRNPWQIAFDRQTGALFAADVGQDLWEEIDVVAKGGNYGWNVYEATHRFPDGPEVPGETYVPPVFEYHHYYGKSITGGTVYRGTAVPELVGKYCYADYVTNALWALDYNQETKAVVANHRIGGPAAMTVMSIGEDQAGELYLMTAFGTIYKYASVGRQGQGGELIGADEE